MNSESNGNKDDADALSMKQFLTFQNIKVFLFENWTTIFLLSLLFSVATSLEKS
jgi:hypothetical protein